MGIIYEIQRLKRNDQKKSVSRFAPLSKIIGAKYTIAPIKETFLEKMGIMPTEALYARGTAVADPQICGVEV